MSFTPGAYPDPSRIPHESWQDYISNDGIYFRDAGSPDIAVILSIVLSTPLIPGPAPLLLPGLGAKVVLRSRRAGRSQ